MSPRGAVAGLLTSIVLAVAAPAAQAAEFGIVPGSLTVRTLDRAGFPELRAGAHPDRLQINLTIASFGTGTSAKDLIYELPPGLGGDASRAPLCPRKIFEEERCPLSTEIGEFVQTIIDGKEEGKGDNPLPIFNVQPAPGQLAQFGGIFIAKTPVSVGLRSSDYGLTLGLNDLSQLESSNFRIELWGVPADHLHGEGPLPPRTPFLTLPTRCGPIAVTVRTRSWLENAPWYSATAETPPLEGCQGLSFEPQLDFALTNPVADAPTGMTANLTFPEYDAPDGLVGAQVRRVDIRFPEGMSVSPAGVSGLETCTDAQFGLGKDGKATCPAASKAGSVTIEGAQLREPLDGEVYLGRERPGERFRLFVAASGLGVDVKLGGSLNVDPVSGQITASLNDLPQFLFRRLALSIDGGPRGLLATPLDCGTPAGIATFEPYGEGAAVDSSSPVAIAPHAAGQECAGAGPFAPTVVAGSTNRKAGQRTGFSMTLRRQDGEQLPGRLDVELPPGFSPALGSVERCGEAEAAAGGCPAASRVGTTIGEVGSGPNPATIEGDVYLTGPYRGAPFGLAMAFHAAIGAFDLGQLVVRGKVGIDSLSGQATIEIDSLPEAFEGVPLRFQTLGLDLNRPGFLRNPTSCAPASITATIEARGGTSRVSKSPFALRGCNSLAFRPTFSMALGGRSQLHRDGKPELRLSARLPRGSTNLRTVAVSLPRLLQFNTSALGELCARSDATEGRCPQSSRVGTSYARTPLLSEKLTGPVYAVEPQGKGAPDLWASVDGTGVHLNLRSETSDKDGRTAVTLTDLPDLSLAAFTMRLDGGRDGVLSLRSGLCRAGHLRRIVSPIAATGQDGAFRQAQVPLAAKAGCAAAASPRAGGRNAHGSASR